MMISPPQSPEHALPARPQSMYGAGSADPVSKPRPQSAGRRARSNSRMSTSSTKHDAATRLSDDELRTSVRVAVRVRPPLRPSDPGFELIPQRFQRSTVQVPTPTSLSVESAQGRKIFIFDRVFGEETDQKGVWSYLEDSVDSFLQGYNVSILAYGQSGAGKSYTMGTSGPAEQFDHSTKGVVPRAATHLFDALQGTTSVQNSGLKAPTRYSVGSLNQVLQNSRNSTDKGWQMSVTYVEIYNEQPRDLLLPEGTPVHERAAVQIREDVKGRIFVEGLKSVTVRSAEELMAVLNHGSAIRQTDATAINSRSSRSHAVFTVNLKQIKTQGTSSPPRNKRLSLQPEAMLNGDNVITLESKLHFVDLAGSERLKNTGATGDRAKEGISINAGLASLGKVIAQLSSRSGVGHVSYRDSKLTRMLQDSLGGNAITYMVACITPAEFHLSETLNTVQYAQRARNIQSKPKIQQINDDADKQAIIDRLRSEVAFLRSQIRSAETGDRRGAFQSDRPGLADLELQNQLLDVQESYRNLSERHAKLVAELSRGAEAGDRTSQEMVNEHAADRLKRSQQNQEQIEEIILEYEKTIQALEANLSTTRGSLASVESNLLERETKCAYIETMNQQLNSRVQKLMDREANTESYLHELEARLEDSTSGGEKHDALIGELRKEMGRIRESEANAEDYICTLEERLAEADQDMEMLQREVERLEQLVERQRSLGKLDNILYELDHIQRKEPKVDPQTPSKGARVNGVNPVHLQAVKEAEETELPPEDDDELAETFSEEGIETAEPDDAGLEVLEKLTSGAHPGLSPLTKSAIDTYEPSPAQTKFMQEKFESVSQELFDLRLEHESTVNEFDLLSAKYQEALRTLAEMQDHLDEARHTPAVTASEGQDSRRISMSEDAKQSQPKSAEELESSRSLSTELSMAEESATSVSDSAPTPRDFAQTDLQTQDVAKLQRMLAQHERSMKDMQVQYSKLQEEHKGTLGIVERLKSDAQRSNSPHPPSPVHGMIRRTSQFSSGTDRGQRSIMSLRTLLADEFERQPDRLEGAEVHLSAATNELQARLDRIQSLETELKNNRKEMDMKSTIISGLTRERNSLKSGAGTPVDLSMVSQMRDQIIQKETELKNLHEMYGKREEELQNELRALRSPSATPDLRQTAFSDSDVEQLRKALEDKTAQHEQAQKDLADREKRLNMSATELEAALASVETLKTHHAEASAKSEDIDGDMFSRAAAANAMQAERDNYQELVSQLKGDLEQQMTTNASHSEKITELTNMHEAASRDIHEHSQIIREKSTEIDQHKATVEQLKAKIKEAESQVEFHKHGLKSLHEAHANEIEEMKLSHAGMLAGYDDQLAELNERLSRGGSSLDSHSSVSELLAAAQRSLGHPTSQDMLANHIEDLAQEKKHIAEANKRLVATNAELESQLTGRQNLQELEESVDTLNQKMNNYQETIRSLANEVGNHEETIREKEKIIKKHEATIESIQAENQKKIILIEELEQQLQSSFEQHHNRVSVIQQQGTQALTEAQQRIALLEKDLQRTSVADSEGGSRSNTMKSTRPQSPQADLAANRSNSITSNLRKSASIASLPSPPPAIPLPPLPTLPGLGVTGVSASNPSPPQSRHTSKEVSAPVTPNPSATPQPKDIHAMKRQSAIIEDQESRLRTMEKHLHAEKQLTATLEEALVDLETQSNKLRVDAEGWKKKAWALEEEVAQVHKERRSERLSVQAVEEEVKKRREAEAARAQLEERMRLLSQSMGGEKKKKKAALNCF